MTEPTEAQRFGSRDPKRYAQVTRATPQQRLDGLRQFKEARAQVREAKRLAKDRALNPERYADE